MFRGGVRVSRMQSAPDGLLVESGVGGGHGDHQADQQIKRGVEMNRGDRVQTRVSDQKAEEIDIDHRPGPDRFVETKNRFEPA